MGGALSRGCQFRGALQRLQHPEEDLGRLDAAGPPILARRHSLVLKKSPRRESLELSRSNSTCSSDFGGLREVEDLLSVSVKAVARNIRSYSAAQITALPDDLLQRVLDELILAEGLDEQVVGLFVGQPLTKLYLEGYPIATDRWVRGLVGTRMQELSLSFCPEMTDASLAVLASAQDLRCLV